MLISIRIDSRGKPQCHCINTILVKKSLGIPTMRSLKLPSFSKEGSLACQVGVVLRISEFYVRSNRNKTLPVGQADHLLPQARDCLRQPVKELLPVVKLLISNYAMALGFTPGIERARLANGHGSPFDKLRTGRGKGSSLRYARSRRARYARFRINSRRRSWSQSCQACFFKIPRAASISPLRA
jgi:hypothetical protein